MSVALPPDLPVSEDEGAADHLAGAPIPGLALAGSDGHSHDLARLAEGCLVLYVYPRTGTPGTPLPDGWDQIPGARGCTPQACGFRDRYDDLVALGATVCGVSTQPVADQAEAASRLGLQYPLLADPELQLATVMRLPTFTVDGRRFYRRLTLVARAGTVAKVFSPVFPPAENAADVIAWLQQHGAAT